MPFFSQIGNFCCLLGGFWVFGRACGCDCGVYCVFLLWSHLWLRVLVSFRCFLCAFFIFLAFCCFSGFLVAFVVFCCFLLLFCCCCCLCLLVCCILSLFFFCFLLSLCFVEHFYIPACLCLPYFVLLPACPLPTRLPLTKTMRTPGLIGPPTCLLAYWPICLLIREHFACLHYFFTCLSTHLLS